MSNHINYNVETTYGKLSAFHGPTICVSVYFQISTSLSICWLLASSTFGHHCAQFILLACIKCIWCAIQMEICHLAIHHSTARRWSISVVKCVSRHFMYMQITHFRIIHCLMASLDRLFQFSRKARRQHTHTHTYLAFRQLTLHRSHYCCTTTPNFPRIVFVLPPTLSRNHSIIDCIQNELSLL